MYDKNLTEHFRLRLSRDDLDYLVTLSHIRQCTVSEVIRSLVRYYKHKDTNPPLLTDEKGGRTKAYQNLEETHVNLRLMTFDLYANWAQDASEYDLYHRLHLYDI